MPHDPRYIEPLSHAERLSADLERIATEIRETLVHPAHQVSNDRHHYVRLAGTELGRTARMLLRARRDRDTLLGSDLFADPAWDMLLDLFASQEEGRTVGISSLCIAASVPPTTALRWIAVLEDQGHIRRVPDLQDKRRAFVQLIPDTYRTMETLLSRIHAARAVP